MEQGLYTKVVKLRRKDLRFISANKNRNEPKFKSQSLSARSQRWFDLDFGWIEFNLITHESYFYIKRFQNP